MLKRPLHRRIKGHFQAHFPSRSNIPFEFPSSIMRKGKDLHVVHCAILSSDSITHQALPGMRKDPRISQMPTVARQHRRLLLFSRQHNALCSKCFSRQSQILEPISSKQKPLQEVFHVYLNKFENVVAHLFLVILGNN